MDLSGFKVIDLCPLFRLFVFNVGSEYPACLVFLKKYLGKYNGLLGIKQGTGCFIKMQ